MSREIDITGALAIGNGEDCPFCKGDTVFVASEDNDIVEHMMNEHPSELNNALFKEPPPKPWLEQPFQLLLAKIYSQLKQVEQERVNEERFEDIMHAIYADIKEQFH
tara:strand:- start:345 stop:665 length:321 start_codon:yes stop_codon:yes gene_type:complete